MSNETPLNSYDNGPPLPPPPPPAVAVVAAPQAAETGECEAPPSITAVLEAANNLRKYDEVVGKFDEVVAVVDNGVAAPGSGPPPSIEEIAEALSDGEEPFFDGVDDDSLPDDNNGNNKPAYTAETVAAISSLMNGEESALFSAQEGMNGTNDSLSGNGKKSALHKKEITLQDRATAMLSVYKDYLQEEEEDDDEGSGNEQVIHPPTLLAANKIPLHHIAENPFLSGNNPHDFRREEIKVATLEKFCRNIHTLDDDDEDDDDSSGHDYEGDDDCNDDDMLLHGRRLHSTHPPSKPPKPTLPMATAATTTAAFRLKAAVALKAVGSKTKKVAKKAAGAVKPKAKDRMTRGEDERQVGEVENGHDFQDYNETMEEEEGDEEYGEVQEEQQDDMEYGVHNEEYDYLEEGQQQHSQNGDEESIMYGMHILDRDEQSLKRKRNHGPTDDEDAVGIFNDLCDELGVTPHSHPGLRHFYQQPRSTRYKYPIFRTKKFRLAMMYGGALLLSLLVIVAIISAVSNGFEEVRKHKAPPLPDWQAEDDWRDQQKLEWEKDHSAGQEDHATNGATEHGDSAPKVGITATKENIDKLFQQVSAAYRPVWYDRTTGWNGQTYGEALTWCDAHDNYIPCPYEVYCPNEKQLLAGVMDEDGESWAPVVNGQNEWVQVGIGGEACELYSAVHGGKHPEWGEDGSLGEEAMTRHIMCCRAHPLQEDSTWNNNSEDDDTKKEGEHVARPDGPPPAPPTAEELKQATTPPISDSDLEIIVLAISNTFSPMWFDRDNGWTGRTYQESLDFCAQLTGYVPCPYEVYCPAGRKKLLDGIQDQGESWSAVIDNANDWVQVGMGGECNLYSETAKELPSWGMTGENNEEITRHIMCCQGAPHFDKIDANAAANDSSTEEATDNTDTTPDTAIISNPDITAPSLVMLPEPQHTLTKLEVQILDAHNPSWFSTNLGWKGTTHDDAKSFCESVPHGDTGGTLHLCPLSAYCPNGPRDTEPLYLQMDAFEGVQWAPTSNNNSEWIMVGKFNDHSPMTCRTYMDIHHKVPAWGLDGTSPELKEHILCCEDNTDDEDGGVLKGEEDEEVDSTIATAPTDGGDEGAKVTDMVIGIQKPKAETENSDSSNNEDDTASQQPGDDNGSGSTVEPSSYMTAPEMLIQDEFRPAWFNTEIGWQGTTYNDARTFCESIPHGDGGTLHLCPLEAYCPNGPRDTEPLYLQMDAFDGVQWAPYTVASPFGNNEAPIENVWVMIGNIGDGAMTCQPYVDINHRDPAWGLDGTSPELKEHILCCEDNTGNDAQAPITTPSDGGDGDDEGEKLTNTVVGIQQGSDSFASTDSNNSSNSDVGDSSASSNSQEVTVFESSITNTFNPMWFDVDRGGWDGGSHDDAIQFCEQFVGTHGKRMELCPYAAYCPSGPSKQVIGGHKADFDEEGEQWAPVFGKSNHWVLIGKRGQNSATSCLSHVQLNGEEPSWGLDGSNKEMTKYVLCCSPLQ